MSKMASSTTLSNRSAEEMALMPPPPPVKRNKRPATALDEDEYVDALHDIIARDYFPGLAEAKAQDEYLSALSSRNLSWIEEAGNTLLHASAGTPGKTPRTTRDTKFDTPRSWNRRTPAPDTPKGQLRGDVTPLRNEGALRESDTLETTVDTTGVSLSNFQAKYTSEDNESFNSLLDKENAKSRQKHAYLWSSDRRILSSRLISYRANESRLLEEKARSEADAAKDGKQLIPLSVGAIAARPAQPDAWKDKNPDNAFMFNPTSVDEEGLQTIMGVKQSQSKAGPKEIVYANTRFPPSYMLDEQSSIPSSPSLNTSIIARRDMARAARPDSETTFHAEDGSETPRVNGYTFVEEDEPENVVQESLAQPTYRDMLAGQTGDAVPNPFTITSMSAREKLHWQLVEKEKEKTRKKNRMTLRPSERGGTPLNGLKMTPIGKRKEDATGDMTPAARNLFNKLGRTPIASRSMKGERMTSKDMWTPSATPRRAV